MRADRIADYLYQSGSVADALRYATIIWPDFVEIDEMIFLAAERAAQPDLEDPGTTLRSRFENDRSRMEREFNLISVPTLFAVGVSEPEAELMRLASVLLSSWRAKLGSDYPERQFVVEMLTGEVDDPTLRFFAVR